MNQSTFQRAGISRLFAILGLLSFPAIPATAQESATPAPAAKEPTKENDEKESASLLEKARTLATEGNYQEAMLVVEKSLAKNPSKEGYQLHAEVSRAAGHHAGSVRAYTGLLKLDPDNVSLYQRRGEARFLAGDFKGSVSDFDKYLEANPEIIPKHWQRGLSHYGAKMFQEGRKQFEVHQTVNSTDVENAVWHFLCVAQLDGVEAARKGLYPYKGDARIPMAQVHDLFAGKATSAEVLAAAGKAANANDKRNQLCYAHLYLALYEEALGNSKKALEHYKLAAEDYRMRHYMGETARVFYEARRATATKP